MRNISSDIQVSRGMSPSVFLISRADKTISHDGKDIYLSPDIHGCLAVGGALMGNLDGHEGT